MKPVEVQQDGLERTDVEVVILPVRRGGPDENPAAARLEPAVRDAFRQYLERLPSVRAAPDSGDDVSPVVLASGPRAVVPVPMPLDEELEAAEAVRRVAGTGIRLVRKLGAASVGFVVPANLEGSSDGEVWQAAAEGLGLGSWDCTELRTPEPGGNTSPERIVWIPEEEKVRSSFAELREAVQRGTLLADVQNRTRRLVTLPGNVATPRYLAASAEELASSCEIRVEVWGPDRLRKEGFGALLAVSRGSAEEPRFLILEWAGAEGSPICLVGKGVTFDAGGISLKPAHGMEAMKYDMAGAAAVFGALEAAARLGLPQRLIGLVPTAENLPSGEALKPGDVIRGLAGTTIEVVNTDAEGRLILADALAFATRLQPRVIVDLATLTGGCVVALGRHAAGLMSPDDLLARDLEESGRRTGERVWRLPLWPAYRKQLQSDIADLKNSAGRDGSPITAGAFLWRFASDHRWAHLDIAGTAWAEEASGYLRKGATGFGVRLLVDWLLRGASMEEPSA